jgi:hypothetical protein
VVLGADGEPLDFPIDVVTPVHFAGFANRKTAERLLPHLRAAVEKLLRRKAERRAGTARTGPRSAFKDRRC